MLTTIHQPSSDVFLMFDYIYVLYDGNLALAGTRDDIIKFLGSLNLKAPEDYNPADFILDTRSLKLNTIHFDIQRANFISQSFKKSSLFTSLIQQINLISSPNNYREKILYDYIEYRNENRASPLLETYQVFKRNSIHFFRDRSLVLMRPYKLLSIHS